MSTSPSRRPGTQKRRVPVVHHQGENPTAVAHSVAMKSVSLLNFKKALDDGKYNNRRAGDLRQYNLVHSRNVTVLYAQARCVGYLKCLR